MVVSMLILLQIFQLFSDIVQQISLRVLFVSTKQFIQLKKKCPLFTPLQFVCCAVLVGLVSVICPLFALLSVCPHTELPQDT